MQKRYPRRGRPVGPTHTVPYGLMVYKKENSYGLTEEEKGKGHSWPKRQSGKRSTKRPRQSRGQRAEGRGEERQQPSTKLTECLWKRKGRRNFTAVLRSAVYACTRVRGTAAVGTKRSGRQSGQRRAARSQRTDEPQIPPCTPPRARRNRQCSRSVAQRAAPRP